jgi:hypothetical protein
MVAHALNLSIQEVKWRVQSQSELHREILSQKTNKRISGRNKSFCNLFLTYTISGDGDTL